MWSIIFFFEDFIRFLYRAVWKLFHLKLYKNPEQHIPKDTFYCYTYNGKNGTHEREIDGEKVMLPYFGIDACPFHKSLFHIDLCMYCGGDCCMDWCKDCGINEGEL